MVYMAHLRYKILIQPAYKAQMALLLAEKVGSFKKYADFSYVFSKKSVAVFLNCSSINKYAIDLKPGKLTHQSRIYT